jgi:hypothetical protein
LGIVWGTINLVIGFFAVQVNPINAGILLLGLLMLGTGVVALRKPSLHSLLSEAVVSLLLLCWNVGIALINVRLGRADHVEGHPRAEEFLQRREARKAISYQLGKRFPM